VTVNIQDSILVAEIAVQLNGKTYRINSDRILKAFDTSSSGDTMGPLGRYFMEIDSELKSLVSVFREIVPVPKDQLCEKDATKMAAIFKTLGFTILDRREH
jgi:hypothetical protein